MFMCVRRDGLGIGWGGFVWRGARMGHMGRMGVMSVWGGVPRDLMPIRG